MTAQKVCNVCGTLYPDTERFCPRDGSALRTVNADPSDLVGQIVADRYLVVRKLGAGGMGQVYLAEHVKMGRHIALKVLKPSLVADPDSIARFNREAANASRISHPNVTSVYDFGETADGIAYLAMEYIDGPTLTKLIAQSGALPPKRTAEIVRQVAEALAVAHDMGIVHRDLKPDNIMIARSRDGSDLVKVVDFGIAKAAGIETQKVTQTGLVVGTPEYMSPEQLAADKLDGRSDIYSLGLVAFNMFTGHMPFQSESAQESIIMRLTDKPKSLTDVRPDVIWPAEVQRVMDRALERDASLRYQVASEFGQDLVGAIKRMSAAIAPTTILDVAPPAVTVPEVAKPVSTASGSRRLAAIVGAAVVVVVGATIGVSVWRGQQPKSDAGSTQQGAAGNVQGNKDSLNGAAKDSGAKIAIDRQTSGVASTVGKAPPRGRGLSDESKGSTPRTPFASDPTKLIIRAAGVSPALLTKLEPAIRRVSGVTVVNGENDPADLILRVDQSGALVVRRTTAADPLATLDTISPAQPLLLVLRHELVVSTLGSLETPDAKRGLAFEIGGGKRSFREKETIAVRVRSEHAGFLTLVDTDPAGVVSVLHPTAEKDLGRLAAGSEARFDSDFDAQPPFGIGVIRAIITEKPLALDLKRDGPVITAANGPVLAAEIQRQIRKQAAAGARWWTASISYTITK